MTSPAVELELAEPHLRGLLSTLGLDVEYVRAEGNTLYYLTENNQEVPVLDYVGGYGSLILGHNNPEIVAYAKELLDAQIPVHAQFSYHPYANELAAALNRIIWREFNTGEPYSAIFANSGAEAIEAAIKHSELDRSCQLAELAADLDAHTAAARDAVRSGAAVVPDRVYDRFGVSDRSADLGFSCLVQEISRRNAERFSRPPLFLTLAGSFHGKLAGSVQLTHNPGYRAPFKALAAQARFVPFDQPGALKKIIDDERPTVLDIMVSDGTVAVIDRDYPVFGGFFVEPIQGEGGINVVSRELAQEIQETADAVGFPIIIDEIQSGVGRSGAFFASSFVGLRGDYYVLAKSLGGGLAKTSVLLVRQSRYRKDFELVHSSTFAKDSFSCHIALKVVKMLEADGGKAYRMAEERGARLMAMLHAVLADFPDVVKEIRGRGLMLGLEFQDQGESTSDLIRENAQAGLLGYVLAGYLLRAHQIRIFQTASAGHTLRFEPSIHVTDTEIDQLGTALRAVCAIIRSQDGTRLIAAGG